MMWNRYDLDRFCITDLCTIANEIKSDFISYFTIFQFLYVTFLQLLQICAFFFVRDLKLE